MAGSGAYSPGLQPLGWVQPTKDVQYQQKFEAHNISHLNVIFQVVVFQKKNDNSNVYLGKILKKISENLKFYPKNEFFQNLLHYQL